MTIVLIVAGFFAIALTVVYLFGAAVTRDDELDRRWAETVGARPGRGDPPSAPAAAARSASRDPEGRDPPRDPTGGPA